MEQQQQAVVVQQPKSAGVAGAVAGQPQNVREWTTGLCGCCEDMSSCCCALFCRWCFLCALALDMNECPLGPTPLMPFCMDSMFIVAMRTKLRSMYGIRGSICDDCCCVCCCNFCTVLQMHRELKNLGHTRLGM